jgi:AraC-like DNA-binding protein
VVILVIVVAYGFYMTNGGSLLREYLSQLNSVLIIAFVVWRVEALQGLAEEEEVSSTEGQVNEVIEDEETGIQEDKETSTLDAMITSALRKRCEATELYLQSDLTLSELARVLGTNRTYLSAYFASQGTTYYGYINRLRIDHFCRLYREARVEGHSATATQLSAECGYGTYRTFADAFRTQKGQTPTEWMRSLPEPDPSEKTSSVGLSDDNPNLDSRR